MLTSSRSFIGHGRLSLLSAVVLAQGFALEPKHGKTVQSSKDEADINTIVERFGVTGQLPQNVRTPLSGDFTEAVDFRTALDAVIEAQRSFDAMPAGVRKRFGNDPAEFVDFSTARDDKGVLVNLVEMRKLGLAVPEEVVIVPPPVRVEVVNQAAPNPV